MSSRRVLVVALVGVATYFLAEPEEPGSRQAGIQQVPAAAATLSAEPRRVSETGITPVPPPRIDEAGRINIDVVSAVVPGATRAPAPVPRPAAALPPGAPLVTFAPPAATVPPADPGRAPVRDLITPSADLAARTAGTPDDRLVGQLLETARLLEQRMERLDGRLDRLAQRRVEDADPLGQLRSIPPARGPYDVIAATRDGSIRRRLTGREDPRVEAPGPDARAMPTPEELPERLSPPVPPPLAAVDGLLGAPPSFRNRRQDPDAARGFDVAVRLIRRLMQRVERLEESLDVQPDAGDPTEAEPVDPSATGLWRQAPAVTR